MEFFQNIVYQARSAPRCIVLPEGEDPRVLNAAAQAVSAGIAKIVLLGDRDQIRHLAIHEGVRLYGIEIIAPEQAECFDQYTEELYKILSHKGMSAKKAAEHVCDPLYFANLMVRLEAADGCVAGAQCASSEVIRVALQIVGKHEDFEFVSSFFIMLFSQPFHPVKGAVVFADCGLTIEPDSEQLAQIAVASADSAQNLIGIEPHVGLLSFSTNRSADHPSVDKVVKATQIARKARPDLKIIGDIQFDAAIDPAIMAHKFPEIEMKCPINVFIFPNLDAGNIAYKIAERIGKAEAVGPILQGMKMPVNDLSRGCKTQDIFNAIAVTVVQAQNAEKKNEIVI